jgi:cysteinyl-tRNA synthetase
MIALVEKLVEKGYAYQVHSGIYFDISKFEGYGRLSRLDIAGRVAGTRVDVNPEKRHPADFALWMLNRPLAFRYLCLTAKYRSRLDSTTQALASAQKALGGLYDFVRSLAGDHLHDAEDWVEEFRSRFREAVNDDLNVPQAQAVVWEMIHQANRRRQFRVYEALLDFDRVLGLGFEDVRKAGTKLPDEVSRLIAAREKARRARDWPKTDALRARIGELGYALEDTPDGTRWKIK